MKVLFENREGDAMPTIEVTAENFEETINNNEIVLIDYWASWCGPCRAFGPIFERVAEENQDVVFGKVDTEKEQALASALKIHSIPTLMIFKEGMLIFSQPGMLPEPALKELVLKVKQLDMNEVRQALKEEQEKAEEEKAKDAN